jgi:hypothetical protein
VPYMLESLPIRKVEERMDVAQCQFWNGVVTPRGSGHGQS